jgi:glutamine cyclotransferase
LQNIFNYTGEGWGLTSDGENLIMSDGTDNIYFRSPGTFKVVRTIQVKQRGTPISNLNELEYIEGYICANVWYKNFIAVINPTTGEVVGRIELDGLKEQLVNAEQADVLNGIAYNPETKHLLITGKLWDTLFEIELAPKVTK